MAEFHGFTLPLGAKKGLTLFNPDFGLEDRPFVPIESSIIEDEANDWLERYGYSQLEESDFNADPNYISSEVGDDEQTASDSKAFIALQPVFHRLFGTKTSLEDTSISPRYGNFAEDLIILPDGYGQTYLNARNTSGPAVSMCYMDIPKLRLATDIRPMRMDHSGTNDGKASMIGSRMRWIPLNSPIRGTFEVFNLFQDVNLGLCRDKKFPYLPESLGGYGKETPFHNYTNFNRFVKSFHQGSHSELIRNIIYRTIDYFSAMENHEYPEKDPLLSHLVRFQSSFHDWIKGRTIYAPVTWYDIPQELAEFRIAKFGSSPVMDDVMGRLLAEGRIISEQKLQIAVEHNELCKALVESQSIPSFRKLRDEARTRFKNLSIFSQENYGMIRELTLTQSRRMLLPLRPIDIGLFFSTVYSKRYNLRHLLGEEYAYWPEAMDAVYANGPMKVSFAMAPLNKVGGLSFAAQKSEMKSDYECTETIGALNHLEEWVRGGCDGPPPTNIINDDNVIIQECSKHPYNVIITDDIKLCREAAAISRNVIFRVPVIWYYKSIYFGTSSWTDYLSQIAPGKIFFEHEDSGSIQSFEESNFRDGVMLSKPVTQRFNIFKKQEDKDPCVIEEFEDFSDGPPVARPESLLFDNRNVLSLRRRPKPRIEPRSRTSSNWRRGP